LAGAYSLPAKKVEAGPAGLLGGTEPGIPGCLRSLLNNVTATLLPLPAILNTRYRTCSRCSSGAVFRRSRGVSYRGPSLALKVVSNDLAVLISAYDGAGLLIMDWIGYVIVL
jgi:hypothetical protein